MPWNDFSKQSSEVSGGGKASTGCPTLIDSTTLCFLRGACASRKVLMHCRRTSPS
jgi:hypothetical protein